MVRFAEWLVLESFMEEVRYDVLMESAVADSLDAIFGYLEEGLLRERDEDEDDDGPVELPDPFTGDEDASPVEIDADYAPEREDGGGSDGGSDSERKEKKRLKKILDALLVIRNEAKRERANIVSKVKELKDELEGSDPDDLDSRSPLDALGHLVELGYLNEDRAQKIRLAMVNPESEVKRSAAEKELNGKIAAAATETGNDYRPSSVSAQEAMGEMFRAMSMVYGRRLNNIARNNQNRIGDRIGHTTYEAEELANETIIRLLNRFKKRQWKDGKPMPWEENDEILRSGDLEHLKKYIFSAIRSVGSSMRRKKNSVGNPASRGKLRGQVASKDAKSRRIRNDLKDDNLSFYLRYMAAAKERPLQARPADEEIVVPSDSEDKIRLAIMRDIEYMVTWTRVHRTEMSMDGDMVRRTLRTYMDNFLKRGEGSITYASTLAGNDDESSADELLSGAAFDHSAVSDDEFDPRSNNPMDAAVQGGEERDANNFSSMAGTIKKTIEDIAKSGSQGPSEAIALCLKLGIKFTFVAEPSRSGPKPKSIVVTDVSKMHTGSSSAGTNDCAGNILRIGLSFAQIRDSWPNGLWRPSIQSVGEYLRGNPSSKGAVQKFCDMFRIH